jgi:hypothetical protein
MARSNKKHWRVFDAEWFRSHQTQLLFWLNGSWLKRKISRHLFRIDATEQIVELGPSYYVVKLDDTQRCANFRTHPKYAKRIYYSLFWYWWMLHFLDWILLDRFLPQLSFGLTDLNVKPDDGEAGDNCDGYAARIITAGGSWTSIRTGSGTSYSNTTTAGTMTRITCHADTDKYYAIRRAGFAFDTAAVGAGSTVSAVVLNLYSTDTYHVNTYDTVDSSLNVVSFAPSNAGAFAAADFNSFGSTIYCAMAYATYTVSNGYKNFTLDSVGRENINKTGITVYGVRVGSDISGTGLTWKADADIAVGIRWVDYTGTASDPSMDVTYTTGTPAVYKPSPIMIA